MAFLEVAAGLVLLIGGAEILVRGAVALAQRLGVSPLVIGLTLVAIGTSAPELVVSLEAAYAGAPGITLGNVVGSNIANVLLILGTAGLLAPAAVGGTRHVRDTVWLLAATGLLIAQCVMLPGVPFWQGLVMLGLVVIFLISSYLRERRQPAAADVVQEVEELAGDKPRPIWLAAAMLLGGLAGIILGGDLLVDGAVVLARMAGVSETVIGVTLVAIGTSMPELATTVVSAVRGHGDVALGNVVGSNIMNILGIVGGVAVLAPGRVPIPPDILVDDLWVMTGATLVLVPFLLLGRPIGRWIGLTFLILYAVFIAGQFLPLGV